MQNHLNQNQASIDHCILCFDSILAYLHKQQPPKYPSYLSDISCPLFVTWHINSTDLRGCIGTFDSQPLSKNLIKYAHISAFQDSRFEPISLKEVERLDVSVSLLVNFQDRNNVLDWEVGRHGIQIEFKGYSGTFLPEVAKEQGWDQMTTIKQLIRKAGYRGDYKNVIDSISIQTYESSKVNINYSQYCQLKQNQTNCN